MKYALVIDGVVDTIALERPGIFVMETFTETFTHSVPREEETLVSVLDPDGNPVMDVDGETPLTEVQILTVQEEVTESVARERRVFVPDERFVECPDDVFGGFLRIKGKFVAPAAPAPEVPETVSARQFKMQLAILGHLVAVENWVRAQPILIQIAYDNSSTFDRNEPALQAGFKALGFSETDLSAFYVAAAKL